MSRRNLVSVVTISVMLLGAAAFWAFNNRRTRTVAEVVRELGPAVSPRWQARLSQFSLPSPPPRLALLAFKSERLLEVWAADEAGPYHKLHTFPILAASGHLGPKLREGDRQVPEGFYRIESLNPNSAFHLSLKLDYPNKFDQLRAREDRRNQPGSNIFIHGGAASIGCLALGDPAIEELFLLVAHTGPEHVRVLIAPRDARRQPLVKGADDPDWVTALYADLTRELATFQEPAQP